MSKAQIVISDKESNEQIYEAPDITTKEITFNYSELEDSENGYKMIPLGDVKNLKKAVINTTVTCSSGASWCGGGGALTFNKLVGESGTPFWGAKSFMYNGGTSDNTVTFDGFFTNGDQEEVQAEIGDTYSELQNWWASSSNDETGADVSVTFNTITLYYEYDNTKPTDPTTPSTSDKEDIVYGDADLSGELEISDAAKIMSYASNPEKYSLSEEALNLSDVYQRGDGINNMDALAVQKKLAQLITELPESYI